MAWTYLAESEESQKPWKATSGQSPIVKMTDMLNPFCCQECLQETCPSLLYGTMCERSTPKVSRTPKSYMVDSPAKISLSLEESIKAYMESKADYFLRWPVLLAKYDQNSSSWKMLQLSLFPIFSESLERFGLSVMVVGDCLYALRKLVVRCTDTVGLFWPRPTATDWKRRATLKTLVKMRNSDHTQSPYYKFAKDYGAIAPVALWEWIMGFPIGWTELSVWATQWF